MNRLRIQEVLVVEGKYDAAALATQVDGLILTTGGFSIFTSDEKIELLQRLGRRRGLVILTDSDAAGFKIRHYIEKRVQGCEIKHAYIPAVPGKESRKEKPSKEGTLGVEGLPPKTLRLALERAGVAEAEPRHGRPITYTDLYELGLSGGVGSAEKRRLLLQRVGLPARLSKRALCQVLSSLYSYEEFLQVLEQKPTLFWDFHGTLTQSDINWFDAAMEAAAEQAPEHPLERETLVRYFSGTCLPWWSIPSRDTRHLTPPGAWWAHCEQEFEAMLQQCGFSQPQAQKIAPAIRPKILQPWRYRLAADTVPTLQALQKRGYQSYILSNNFPELEEIATALGLAPYFGQVFVSGKIGFDKPRKEIFDFARAAAQNPAECWMIGDSFNDDIVGGSEAGFTTVLVGGSKAAPADFAVKTLAEVLEILP